MKITLLSILCCLTPALAPMLRAQENPSDGPREGRADLPEPQERRLKMEMTRFHEEMAEQMKGSMEKAAQLETEGKNDEAEKLRSEARQKMQRAMDDHQRAMQAKMQEMNQRRRAEKIENDERQREAKRQQPRSDRAGRDRAPDRPDGFDGPDHRPDGPPPSDLQRKLHHVEQAIGHLRDAGLPDPAADLERVAQRLRRAMHDQDGQRGEGDPRREDELGALRREVEELKKAVNELCKMREQDDKEDSPEKHH